MSIRLTPDRLTEASQRDGFVGIPQPIVDAIRKVEEAREQYALHAWKPRTTREQRDALQGEKVAARTALSNAILAYLVGDDTATRSNVLDVAADLQWLDREAERLDIAERRYLEDTEESGATMYAEDCAKLSARCRRIAAALRAGMNDSGLVDLIEKRELLVQPQCNGGWVIGESVPTGGGDYSEVELARTRSDLRTTLTAVIRRTWSETTAAIGSAP